MEFKKVMLLIIIMGGFSALLFIIIINSEGRLWKITGHAVAVDNYNMSDITQLEDKKPGDCWNLEDGRKVCYFGKREIDPGELTNMNPKIKEKEKNPKPKSNGGASSPSSPTQNNTLNKSTFSNNGTSIDGGINKTDC